MTKKEAIIQYFSSMDLEMLELLLDENRTYQDASKEIFLEKVGIAFEEFKSNGDTYLTPAKGKCDSTSCNNDGCSGFAFIGNNSNKRLPLIFEDHDNDYADIYSCSTFKTSEDSDAVYDIFLHISKDEKATFKPSINYLLRANECENALMELEKYKGQVIGKEVYANWYTKHTELFKSLPGLFSNYNAFSKFNLLWFDLEDIIKTLLYDSKARKALQDYESLSHDNENELLNWLLKYEEMGQHIALFLLYKEGCPYLNDPIPTERIEGVYIDQKDFLNYIDFSTKYDKGYELMLQKYNTFENGVCPPNVSHEDFYSLRYHLNKKGFTNL